MKTKKAFIDGQEIDVVIELEKDYKDDTIIEEKNIEDTIELSKEELENAVDSTSLIEVQNED